VLGRPFSAGSLSGPQLLGSRLDTLARSACMRDIYPPPTHACNVSCAHRTISVDSEAAPHRAMREALEVLRAAHHPSMAHRSGAHRLWPAAPLRGAGVAGGDLSAVSGLHPRETRAVAAAAAREPPRVPGPLPPERRCPGHAARSPPARSPASSAGTWPEASWWVRRSPGETAPSSSSVVARGGVRGSVANWRF